MSLRTTNPKTPFIEDDYTKNSTYRRAMVAHHCHTRNQRLMVCHDTCGSAVVHHCFSSSLLYAADPLLESLLPRVCGRTRASAPARSCFPSNLRQLSRYVGVKNSQQVISVTPTNNCINRMVLQSISWADWTRFATNRYRCSS